LPGSTSGQVLRVEAYDDALDTVIGLFGMLEVVLDRRAPGEPIDEEIKIVEGWILGAADTAPLRRG
jgi:hypothetical protein